MAVATFLTAAQTYVQQRNQDTIRDVYNWILGRLSTAGWSEVTLVLPYVVVATAVLLVHRRALDVLAVGDDEASNARPARPPHPAARRRRRHPAARRRRWRCPG